MCLNVLSKSSGNEGKLGVSGVLMKGHLSLSKTAKAVAVISASVLLYQTDAEIRNSCVLAGVTLTLAGAAVKKTEGAFSAFVENFHEFLEDFGAG